MFLFESKVFLCKFGYVLRSVALKSTIYLPLKPFSRHLKILFKTDLCLNTRKFFHLNNLISAPEHDVAPPMFDSEYGAHFVVLLFQRYLWE